VGKQQGVPSGVWAKVIDRGEELWTEERLALESSANADWLPPGLEAKKSYQGLYQTVGFGTVMKICKK